MRVTFVFHSCFVVELERTVLIFDYYGEGTLPKLPKDKKIYFLASHGHRDHFDKKIFKCRKELPLAEYILSWDIRLTPDEERPWIHKVKRDEELVMGPIAIRTLKSTDKVVAFQVKAEEVSIYHAGDLNWWHWEGEDKGWNNNMAANYKREIHKIEGQHFDLAFVVLDPRLGGAYDWGMNYFLEHTDNDHVFPMHCWQDYQVGSRFLEARAETYGPDGLDIFHSPEYPGQVWEFAPGES